MSLVAKAKLERLVNKLETQKRRFENTNKVVVLFGHITMNVTGMSTDVTSVYIFIKAVQDADATQQTFQAIRHEETTSTKRSRSVKKIISDGGRKTQEGSEAVLQDVEETGARSDNGPADVNCLFLCQRVQFTQPHLR